MTCRQKLTFLIYGSRVVKGLEEAKECKFIPLMIERNLKFEKEKLLKEIQQINLTH